MATREPGIRVFEDREALSQAAATEFADACKNAVSVRGRFLVALSGGGTPLELYRWLSRAPYRNEIEWGSLHVFWGDERCVPFDDPESNYGQARDAFLSQVPVPPQNVHPVRTELEPEQAADDYALLLKQYAIAPLDWPRFDLVLLGVGEDGHAASLFPGSAVRAGRAVLAVTGRYQDRPTRRVTLTPLVFNSARKVVFLVSGAAKAKIVADILQGKRRPAKIPAQRIRPADGAVTWLLDRAAAAEITGIGNEE